MAQISEVKSALDSIADMIANSRQSRDRTKAQLLSARNQLANIPNQYSDVLATIDNYTGDGATEELYQDEKAKLATEFVELKSVIETELTALGVEFS